MLPASQSRSLVLAVPMAAQAQKPAAPTADAAAAAPSKPAAKPWTASRTPWGDPDLQGIWNFATSTPLERPAELGEKPILSDAEAEEFEEKLAFGLTRDRRDGGNEADVRRAYNEHWMDPRRLQLLTDKRTSLIVDPPDGRIPPRVDAVAEQRADAAARRPARLRPSVERAGFHPAGRWIIDVQTLPGTIYNIRR